jgi:uncharacterized membrane protein YgaE (UPF0421/DUF939 family)
VIILKIGLRTVKTGIAVTISMFIASLFKDNNPFYAAVAALIVMQPTVSDSWKIGINRMLGTLLGAVLGVIFAFISFANPLLAGLGIIVLIIIMNTLGWHESIAIAGVVFVGIFMDMEGPHIFNAFHRVVDTFIGILTAVLVNYIIFPPIYDKKVILRIKSISKEIWLYSVKAAEMVLHEKEGALEVMTEQIETIQKELEESQKFLELQRKEEKVKVYGSYRCQEMNINVKLLKEIFQHLKNIHGILEKGIRKETVFIIKEDVEKIEVYLKDFVEQYIGEKVEQKNYHEDLEIIIDAVKQAKRNLKRNEEINKFPTDEIVKLLVFLYNLEETVSKYNMIKIC